MLNLLVAKLYAQSPRTPINEFVFGLVIESKTLRNVIT